MSPVMGTIALSEVSYDEGVDFRCDASAAKSKVCEARMKIRAFCFLPEAGGISRVSLESRL